MSNEWDGKVVMSTPGGPIVEMSLGDLLARKDAEIERLRADLALERSRIVFQRGEIERLRAENERMHASFKNLALKLRRGLEGKP